MENYSGNYYRGEESGMSIEVCLKRFIDSEILAPGEMGSLKEDVMAVLTRQLGKKPLWKEGTSLNEESFPLGGPEILIQLQRYAAHIDLMKKPPETPTTGEKLVEDKWLLRYWEQLDNELTSKELSFKHVIWTGSIGIFFIPVDFPEPLLIEEDELDGEEGAIETIEYISIGSSYQLLKELNTLNHWLKLQGDYGDLGEMVSVDVFENDADPWHEIKWAWLVLHWMARQSIEKQLTICCE
jgi:hypothetical protein